jgi:hypothetical protein
MAPVYAPGFGYFIAPARVVRSGYCPPRGHSGYARVSAAHHR